MMTKPPFETLRESDLAAVAGGMRWQDLRRSNNVEDRRTPAGKRRDQEWWEKIHRNEK